MILFSANGICPRYFLYHLSVPFPLHLLYYAVLPGVRVPAHRRRGYLYSSDPSSEMCGYPTPARPLYVQRGSAYFSYTCARVDTARILFTE